MKCEQLCFNHEAKLFSRHLHLIVICFDSNTITDILYYSVEYEFNETLFKIITAILFVYLLYFRNSTKHFLSRQLYLKYICKIPGFNVNVLNEHSIVWLGVKPDPLFCNLVQVEDSELFHVQILIFQDGVVPIIVTAYMSYGWAQGSLKGFSIYDKVFMVVM